MKIIYSHLKNFLPSLDIPAKKLADDLTLIGHFCDGLTQKQGETIISLEVRQNRGDCLGYLGIAKDLAVFYDLKLDMPLISLPPISRPKDLDIQIKAKKIVERVMAIRISDLKNRPSPAWLKKFLFLHDINSLNTLIDLTNYIALLYGIPCHAFDTKKMGQKLVWEINKGQYKTISTFEETKLDLKKGDFLITNEKEAVSLSFIGGKNSGIDLNTQETIMEMADYDRAAIRKECRKFNIITEAGIRLEKDLDPELIPQSFNHLIMLVLRHCGGKISSNCSDFYLHKVKIPKIPFGPQKPKDFSGINISAKFSLQILKRLGCQVEKKGKKYLVIPPSLRPDLGLEEDLIEEVLRFYGYDKIPTNQPLAPKKLRDITPKIIYLIEVCANIFIKMGYDEIRSWPLTSKKGSIKVLNSPDSRRPYLRASMISSLLAQARQYQKYKVRPLHFFEVGKTFSQVSKKFEEVYSLGLCQENKQALKKDIEEFSAALGVKPIASLTEKKGLALAEINLNELLKIIKRWPKIKNPESNQNSVVELNKQIISLDANVVLGQKKKPEEIIKKYAVKVSEKRLWNLIITDLFYQPKTKNYKYTFRASYYNLDAKAAKKLHLRVFGLMEKE
ncbi:MAG: phenylalanine--tRNA ligase beta subunit-related protein [Candidatus Shapirobacteria bacterium]